MVTHCKECKNFVIKNKKIRGFDGSVAYLPQHKCRLGYKISESSKDGWIPIRKYGFICDKFIKK